MKKKIPILLLLCTIMAACPMSSPSGQSYGSLVISFATGAMKGLTIVPPLDMDISHYNLSGSGPGSAVFSRSNLTGTSVVENSLVAGTWLITVDAFNSAGTLIGTGTVSVIITAGQTSLAEVQVAPLAGTGSLSVSISWPLGTIGTPSATCTLTPAGGTSQDVTLTADSTSASGSVSALNAGYYSMSVQLWDGTVLKWGRLEDVRILKDQLTQATFSLTAEDFNVGGLNLTITPRMQAPIAISLSGQQPLLVSGDEMTVASVVSEGAIDSYQWYLSGGPLAGKTASSITIGNGLATGSYRLDLEVRKGNVLSSNGVSFVVLPLPSETVSTNVGKTGTKLDIFFYRGSQFTGYPLYTMWVEDAGGGFLQDLLVCSAPGTNIYPFSAAWIARPMSVPYWAHKACVENPYAGDPTRSSPGMYLALPTADGGPIPADLDAVTSATRGVDFALHTARDNDGISEFRVMLEINRSWDYNSYYSASSYDPGGQPSIVYAATVQANSATRYFTLSPIGSGSPLGSDGSLYSTDNCTTALALVGKVVVRVTP